MSLIENLYSISSIKADIKSAIEAKGVDMTGVSFAAFPEVIYNLPSGSTIIGITMKQVAERTYNIVDLWDSTISIVRAYAFYCDSTISTVDIQNANYIESNAFYSCNNLTYVSAPNCLNIYSSAFTSCSNLQSVYLNKVSWLPGNTFKSCIRLTDVYLPVCEKVSNNDFDGCSSLSEIYLPECTSIHISAAFRNTALNKLTLGASTVCVLYSYGTFTAFSGTPIAAGTGSIYVPASLVSDYQAANHWSDFSSQIFSIPEP